MLTILGRAAGYVSSLRLVPITGLKCRKYNPAYSFVSIVRRGRDSLQHLATMAKMNKGGNIKIKSRSNVILATREEKLSLEMEVDGAKLNDDEIRKVKEQFGIQTTTDDELTVNYEFYLDYIGNVVKNLELIESLLDKATILKVQTNELNYSKCLVQDLFNKLEVIEEKIKR